ncbi:hypothetical protein LTR78_009763 [Recurvomyces mirabilis]|uniref:Xylanolytic transcriptional activator regulatory domain-containing protein n=1 Tax=Recurvomyces mirabilis TaxID=574656 RepID=A0AAE0TNX4_9PEZI|nr:hypothetical protein LTR78_009763 [Recurvomyces mirabilis]KAK5158181.1 hypothetical protein LTS14_003199 [Recurvomyces mirabilis]
MCQLYNADCTYEAAYRRGKHVRPSGSESHHRLSGSAPPAVAAARPATIAISATNGQLADVDNDVPDGAVGQSSAFVFLKRAWDRFHLREDRYATSLTLHVPQSDEQTSIFSYGDKAFHGANSQSCALPPSTQAEELFALYFDFAMPTYRFLHRQTAARWLEGMLVDQGREHQAGGSTTGQRAIIWLIMATSVLFKHASNLPRQYTLTRSADVAEGYLAAAKHELSCERGRPKLESVQARLAMCLYLLHASRPTTAWYDFGTTVQLAFVLGLHRDAKDINVADVVTQECRKRTFWALTTLDTYMSVLLGRPNLINDRDISQDFPRSIDDEHLLEAQVSLTVGDCVIQASICHAKLARITKTAAQNQMRMESSENGRLHAAIEVTGQLRAWRAELPAILSGVVQPSSLIPIFRRQTVVLQLAYSHARMLVTRPLLLLDSRDSPSVRVQISSCLEAAVATLDALSSWADDGTSFAAFWLTQYVAFNAVSIIYVYIIQARCDAGKLEDTDTNVEDLLRKASKVQKYFEEVAALNAPSLRYYAVLQELQRAVESALQETSQSDEQMPPGTLDNDVFMPNSRPSNLADGLDLDFWLQLDSFPFCKYTIPSYMPWNDYFT